MLLLLLVLLLLLLRDWLTACAAKRGRCLYW
jgi:hypothetical protein